MGIFGFRKKRQDTVDFTKNPNAIIPMPNSSLKFDGDVVDLRNLSYSPAKNKVVQQSQESIPNNIDFLNTMALSSKESKEIIDETGENSEVKNKMRMLSSKIEDYSNEVYKLLQRIELLERKIERLEGRTAG